MSSDAALLRTAANPYATKIRLVPTEMSIDESTPSPLQPHKLGHDDDDAMINDYIDEDLFDDAPPDSNFDENDYFFQHETSTERAPSPVVASVTEGPPLTVFREESDDGMDDNSEQASAFAVREAFNREKNQQDIYRFERCVSGPSPVNVLYGYLIVFSCAYSLFPDIMKILVGDSRKTPHRCEPRDGKKKLQKSTENVC